MKDGGFESRPEHLVVRNRKSEVASLPQTQRGLFSPFVANIYLQLTEQFNAECLRHYQFSSRSGVEKEISNLSPMAAHEIVVTRALQLLVFAP
jgi:hypothetical protein